MYCIKCKQHTEDASVPNFSRTKNGRFMKQARCKVCGIMKSSFVKAPVSGSGVINSAINSLPVELHLPGHQFTGPGTKLDKRLNTDGTPKPWSKPINRVDKISMEHDICYRDNPDTKSRNEICDKQMVKSLNEIPNPSMRERLDRAVVKPIIIGKKTLGLGLKKTPAMTKVGCKA